MMPQDKKSLQFQVALSESMDAKVYIAKELRRMADGEQFSQIWAVNLCRAAADLLEEKNILH